MKADSMFLRVVAMAVVFATSAQAGAEPLPPCSDAEVQYSDPQDVSLKGRVTIRKLAVHPDEVRESTDPEYQPFSPQRTAAFNRVRVADTGKPGPWNNSIQIFTIQGKPIAWQIDANDLRDNATIQWLNEDLLFLRVWWGRIVSTDLIFQLSTGRFIYAQEANYGLLGMPCE
jgi:hypothetical protein